MPDFHFLLTTRLSPDQQAALATLERVCHEAKMNLYLTGGPLRDLWTGQPVRFLNLTTEGDPMGLGGALKAAGAEHLSSHAETRSLHFHLEGSRVRMAAARAEASAGAGGKPGKAAPGTILEDLRQRGLTINSIGLSLNPASRFLLLDPANGAADIEARLIRMNHSYVFLEDPIVLLRAVRLATRLGFEIEERTRGRMEAAQEGDYLERASAGARGQEWEAIAYEPDPAAAVRALDKGGWLGAAFGGGVKAAKINLHALSRIAGCVEAWDRLDITVDAGLVAMPFLLGGLAPSDATRLAANLPSRHLAAEWKGLRHEAQAFEKKLLALGVGPGWLQKAWDLVGKAGAEAVAFASVEPGDAKAGRRLKEFQTEATALRQRLPLLLLRSFNISPQSEEGRKFLRPWYERMLRGEKLLEVEIAEGVKKAVLAAHPPPPPPRVEIMPRRRGRLPRALTGAPAPKPPEAKATAAGTSGTPAATGKAAGKGKAGAKGKPAAKAAKKAAGKAKTKEKGKKRTR